MERLASMLPEYPVVMEMYGVGKSFGPQLMAEIGDVRRFERKQSPPQNAVQYHGGLPEMFTSG